MMTQMMEEVDHKYRTYLHERGQPVPKPVDLSGCVNACAAPAPETPEQLIETEEGEVSEGPAPPAAPAPLPPPGPSAALIGPPPTLREYTEERIHTGPEGVHREIVRGVETEPVAVPPVQDMQLRRIDETVLQWVFLTTGIDGIVVDKERAENPNIPCKVTEYTKEDGKTIALGFKPGVIGMLSPEQLERFCPPGAREGFPGSEDLKRRFAVFSKASEKCKLATEGGPKGIVHLEDRLQCMAEDMAEEARKHGALNGGLPGGA